MPFTLFLFLQYVSPTWYYRLVSQSRAAILVDYTRLSPEKQKLIELDPYYLDDRAIRLDAAYQGLVIGLIPTPEQCLTGTALKNITDVTSNYRFLRKYYGVHWYLYVFVLRLFTLHNPICETTAFFRSLRVKRKNLYVDRPGQVEAEFENFESLLVTAQPLVTIVIPTLNRYEYLRDVLADLEKQDYTNFEVLVCDQSEPMDTGFYVGWQLDLRLIPQREKALWLARNRCIQESRGEYILLFDDDSRVESDWIRQHLKALDYFEANISAGVTDTIIGGGLSPKSAYFHLSDVFDTGNAMVHKEVFRKVGLFDRQFEKQRMGDGEFGLRAFLAGYQLVSNPYARRLHLKVGTGGLRQMGSWDSFRPKSMLSPRPVPSVLYLARKYFGSSAACYWLLSAVPPSLIPYKFKKNRFLKVAGFVFTLLLLPFIFVQVYRSWTLSSRKLGEGHKIPNW